MSHGCVRPEPGAGLDDREGERACGELRLGLEGVSDTISWPDAAMKAHSTDLAFLQISVPGPQ